MVYTSRGVLVVEQVLTLGGTTFPEKVKSLVCFLETFVPKLHVSAQQQQDGLVE